jgi:hypothetical protein
MIQVDNFILPSAGIARLTKNPSGPRHRGELYNFVQRPVVGSRSLLSMVSHAISAIDAKITHNREHAQKGNE